MEVGEKYLSIKITGHEYIKAYPNKEGKAKNPNAPDFKADGVAVWEQKKKEPKKDTTTTENITQ